MHDLTNQQFGRWTVIELSHRTKHRESYWLCRCECGNTNAVRSTHLTKGLSQSCGCLQRELAATKKRTHNLSYHPLYKTWTQMKQRCHNPNSTEYHNYGERGIFVCTRWRDGFPNFLADMGEPPEGMTLDRIDNDGPYSPDNCRWSTVSKQARNTRRTKVLTYQGQARSVIEWAGITGLHPNTIRSRLRYGWSVADALTRPVDTRCHHKS